MSHDLAKTNGQIAMMYTGTTPWHRLGTKLDEPPTAELAIAAAGLNYQVALRPLVTDQGLLVEQRKAVLRTDTNDVLGVVGNSYKPVQNHECFSFLDSVVADGQLRYHTAGALGKGEKVWMLAQLPGEISLRDSEDVTQKFLLLSNSHDGSSALRVFFTPIRVVCANTLAMAQRRSGGQGVSIIHKGNLSGKVTKAREILGFASNYYDKLHQQMEILAHHYPTRTQLESYFASLYPDVPTQNNQRSGNVRAELWRLFQEGRGQQIASIRDTTWAAFNAVTEYVDHHRVTRGSTDRQRADRRLASAWFGSGARLKSQAWVAALDLAS